MKIDNLKRLMDRCWSAASKLESQVIRNGDNLPKIYRQMVSEAFLSLSSLRSTIEHIKGPWRVSGITEDGRMYKLSNREGFVVCHVYSNDVANMLVELSHLDAGELHRHSLD